MKFNQYYETKLEQDTISEIISFEQHILEYKKTHPSKGISEKKRSDTVKRAKRGEDMFGTGKNFDKIAKAAGKRYGDEEAGKRIAGAIFWKKAKGKHMTKEDADDLLWIIEDEIEIIQEQHLEGI